MYNIYAVQTSTRTSVKSQPQRATSVGAGPSHQALQAPVSNLLGTKSKLENSLGPGQASVLSVGAHPSQQPPQEQIRASDLQGIRPKLATSAGTDLSQQYPQENPQPVTSLGAGPSK